MPFVLTNAPATLQRTMDMTFSDMIDYTDIYVDDIVVYSESLEDHLVHLRKVLQRLREHQLFVKLKKCSFAQSEIEFVGFIVGRKGIRPVPEKLQTISDWPVPKMRSTYAHFSVSVVSTINSFRNSLPSPPHSPP